MQTKANMIFTLTTPKAGEWIIFTKLQKEEAAALYDPADPDYATVSALLVRGFPYGVASVKLRWSELITEEDLALPSKDGSGKMFSSPRRFLGSNLIVATREEWVNFRQFEQHPLVAEVTSNDGAYMEIVVMVNYEITNPLLAIRCQDIFEYAIGYIQQEFRTWAGGIDPKTKEPNTYKKIRSLETDGSGVPTEIEKKIWYLNGDTVDGKKKPINPDPTKRKPFEKFGFRVDSMSVFLVALSKDSIEFRESEEKIAIEENNYEAAKHTQKILLLQNAAQEARNDTEYKFREKDTNLRIKLIRETSDALRKVNKAWTEGSVTHLFFGSGSPNVQTGNLVSDLMQTQDFVDHDTDERRKPKNQNSGGTNK